MSNQNDQDLRPEDISQLCDRIRKSDPKYEQMQVLVEKTGCTDPNNDLTVCLYRNNKQWNFCLNETLALSECMKNSKFNEN